jgi:metallo-beta-lactamase family protein
MHPEVYDAEIRQFLLTDTDKDPFGFAMLTYTHSVEESKELNFLHEPAIIISASGMAETGRILHHLKNRIEDPRNTILIVGFQAPDTLGRRIVERTPVVRIFGDEYRLKAHVEVLEGFSGHADRNDLLGWVGAMQQKPRRTFLVHGEEASSLALADGLRREIGLGRVDVPTLHETVEI